MRKLVTIEVVDSVEAIPGADMIEVATVKGWKAVVGKNKFKAGDKALFYEVDSYLPILPEYEFLRKGCYKKMPDGTEGFRLKTIRLLGVLSQGLLMPITLLPTTIDLTIGAEVAGILGVKLYEPPIPTELSGEVFGAIPSCVPRTDEERIQNLLPSEYEGKELYATEKLDGTSATFYLNDGHFGCCGRNWEYKESGGNAFWRWAKEHDLENKLKTLCYGKNIAVQGELIGHGVQGNHYKMNKTEVCFFTAYDIDAGKRLNRLEFIELLDRLGLVRIPDVKLNSTDYLKEADGKSALNPTVDREGIVLRDLSNSFSFKAISNSYLLKHET